MLYGKKREKYFRHDLILIEDLIKDLDMKKVISK